MMNSFKAALIIPIILFINSVEIFPKRKFKELNFVKENLKSLFEMFRNILLLTQKFQNYLII
jgi:hypothetical protein